MSTKHPRIAVAIPPALKAGIAHLAAKHHRTQSGEIAVALEQWVQSNAADMADMDLSELEDQ
jgi:predicted transcriptional regulator